MTSTRRWATYEECSRSSVARKVRSLSLSTGRRPEPKPGTSRGALALPIPRPSSRSWMKTTSGTSWNAGRGESAARRANRVAARWFLRLTGRLKAADGRRHALGVIRGATCQAVDVAAAADHARASAVAGSVHRLPQRRARQVVRGTALLVRLRGVCSAGRAEAEARGASTATRATAAAAASATSAAAALAAAAVDDRRAMVAAASGWRGHNHRGHGEGEDGDAIHRETPGSPG